jgi:signal peptidase II
MAFGIRWESEFGKLALTIFRIGAMIGIAWYLYNMAKKGAHSGFLICMSLILGGAVGNVIDSTFYGVLFNNALIGSPTKWFHGQVIDMLFFPLFDFYWPEWMPNGGEYFLFFSPVFNIADSSIFLGVATILIFQKRFFAQEALDFQSKKSDVTPQGIDATQNSVTGDSGDTGTEEKTDQIKPLSKITNPESNG